MKKFIIFLALLLIVLLFSYWRTIANKPVFAPGQSQYETVRAELFDIVNAEEFDSDKFREFILTLPPYRLDRWPQEFWYSITFADPRGDITVYQDIMMGVALGVHRLWEIEDPQFDIENKVTEILNRRSTVWHDFHWQNHYTREYAALSALAHVIGDIRFNEYQKNLHESLASLYLTDGSSQEGTSYGFYTIKLLAPYVYLTSDGVVKKYIDDYYTWSAKAASEAGWLPPFDNSRLMKLPINGSYFSVVNNSQDYSSFESIGEDYLGKNESVFKNQDLTVWVRHKLKLKGKTYHQHFSSGDVIMKSLDYWWLIPPGYDNTQDLNRPKLHNIASVKNMDSVWWWKLRSFLGKDYACEVVESDDNYVKLKLFDNINREVVVGEDALVVRDTAKKKEFNVYWHILGEIVDQNITDEEVEIYFKQGTEYLIARWRGFDSIEAGLSPHALFNSEQQKHTLIHLTGREITSEFLIQ